jgi:hypothetical protein
MRSTRSQKYSYMYVTQNFLIYIFAYEYQNYAEFYADSKFVEIIGKSY